jgi:hypothetical protein
VAQDFVMAAEWYEKAAAGGCVVSRHQLGEMYYWQRRGGARLFAGGGGIQTCRGRRTRCGTALSRLLLLPRTRGREGPRAGASTAQESGARREETLTEFTWPRGCASTARVATQTSSTPRGCFAMRRKTGTAGLKVVSATCITKVTGWRRMTLKRWRGSPSQPPTGRFQAKRTSPNVI